MNICITNLDFNPQFIGGIKRVSSILAKEWIKECDVCFLAFSPKDNQVKEIEGIPQYHFPLPENILAEENVDYFTQFIKEHNIDIILHQHCDNVQFTELCIRVAKKENIKLITSLHFAITHKNDIAKRAMFIKYKLGASPIAWIKDFVLFIKFHLYTKHKNTQEDNLVYCNLIEHSSKLVLLSPTFIPILARQLNLNDSQLKKVTAISNPIEILEHKITKKEKRVLWCGRVEYGMKRVDRMLEIWKSIAPRHPDWELYIMGSGNIEYFKNITIQHNIPNVHFTGFCNPYNYYKEGSILCMTSSTEGWGMVLVEAQMFDCVPIVYNSFDSLQEIITDKVNGYIVPAFNKEKFAECLEWLMDNEDERNKMIEECQKSVKRFDVNIIAQQWMNLFNEVIQEK